MSVQTTITIEELLNRDLITEQTDQTYKLNEEIRQTIKTTDLEAVEEHPTLQNEPQAEQLIRLCESDPEFLRKYTTVAEKCCDLPFETKIALVFILDQFIEPRPNAGGVPNAFLPVRGQHLQTAIKLHPRSVVYAWRRNCDSCELMKQTLNEVFENTTDEYGLFAVYGSDCAVLLQEQFDIEGAPTTLFCANGAVDSRLVGSQYAQSIESEIEMIEQRAGCHA